MLRHRRILSSNQRVLPEAVYALAIIYFSCLILSGCPRSTASGGLSGTNHPDSAPENARADSKGSSEQWWPPSIAVGDDHVCSTGMGGSVYCWGSNEYGQLGIEPLENSSSPVKVQGGLKNVVEVGAGHSHTCALSDTGIVSCWGSNEDCQIGSGGESFGPIPRPVKGLANVVALDVLGDSNCAVTADGEVLCWGKLDPTIGVACTATPTPLKDAIGASTIAHNPLHWCALTAGGNAYCGGDNLYGQIGNGTQGEDVVPSAPVSDLTEVASVHVLNNTSFALREDGTVWCWGHNDALLGVGEKCHNLCLVPTMKEDLASVGILATGFSGSWAGYGFACAILDSGQIECWGANYRGQLGNGTLLDSSVPTKVVGVEGAVAMAATNLTACAATADGLLWCWGRNTSGQLGTGSTPADDATLTRVNGPVGFSSLSATSMFSCATGTDERVWCWGASYKGNYGSGYGNVLAQTPTQVSWLAGVSQVSAGAGHSDDTGYSTTTCAVVQGTAWCWGNNDHGQVGDGTTEESLQPVPVIGLPGAKYIATGYNHSCAIGLSGGTWCWGKGTSGAPGQGGYKDSTEPIQLVDLSHAVQVGVGDYFTCARTEDVGVSCWGWSSSAMGNDDDSSSEHTPKPVEGMSEATDLAVGKDHVCAAKSDGTLWCWGRNYEGQLGQANEELESSTWPLQVEGLSNVVDVETSHHRSCALTADDELYCWGDDWGIPGHGAGQEDAHFEAPERVDGLAGIESFSVGEDHACVLLDNGETWCWGNNKFGQLGDGSGWSKVPLQVKEFSPN
jgi:alpha-tubulin suppressor-like RCC1 family protein